MLFRIKVVYLHLQHQNEAFVVLYHLFISSLKKKGQ